MKIGIIIQATTSSMRLSKKVLYSFGARVTIHCIIDSMQKLSPSLPIVVATSTEEWDDAIVRYCRGAGITWYRGPFKNVALRILEAADTNGFGAIVRVCGDSPLLDYRLVEQGVSLYGKDDFDLVTNVHPRTFPQGQSVEIIRKEALRSIIERLKNSEDKEHVTRYFYRNEKDFRIYNFPNKENYSHIQLSLDTVENRTVIERIFSKMIKPPWQYRIEDIVQLYNEVI